MRRVWTPNKELVERFESLDPRTALDSEIRDLFCRTIQQIIKGSSQGKITLNMDLPNTGNIRWERAVQEVAPGINHEEVTVWWEP